MSVPVRATLAPSSAPVVDAGPWSDPGPNPGAASPARALQRRLADEWSPPHALPESSALAPRLEAVIAAVSRVGGPILFGATLAVVASLLT